MFKHDLAMSAGESRHLLCLAGRWRHLNQVHLAGGSRYLNIYCDWQGGSRHLNINYVWKGGGGI